MPSFKRRQHCHSSNRYATMQKRRNAKMSAQHQHLDALTKYKYFTVAYALSAATHQSPYPV